MLLRAAEALGDVVAGQLDVHPAGIGAERRGAPRRTRGTSSDHVVEVAGLVAAGRRRRCCRASGRTPTPRRRRSRPSTSSTSGGSRSRDPAGAHPGDEGEPTGHAGRGRAARPARRRRRASPTGRASPRSGWRCRETKSTWAPSRSRVRSPTQTMCAGQVVAARRACPSGSAPARTPAAAPRGWRRARTPWVARVRSRSMPHARMKSSARSMSRGQRLVALAGRAGRTKSLFQSCTAAQVGEAAAWPGPHQVQRRGAAG